jgi:hypothetical protein
MKRVKLAFDPHGILNPGKIFPDEPDQMETTTVEAGSSDPAKRS